MKAEIDEWTEGKAVEFGRCFWIATSDSQKSVRGDRKGDTGEDSVRVKTDERTDLRKNIRTDTWMGGVKEGRRSRLLWMNGV